MTAFANLLPFMETSQRFGDIKGTNMHSSSDRGRNDGKDDTQREMKSMKIEGGL